MPWPALASALLVLVASRTGRAEPEASPPGLSTCFDWAPGPQGCPTAEQTENAVADLVGHAVLSASPCPILVRGGVRRLDGSGWEANLSFSNSAGQALGDRTLQSQTSRCAALKDPVALVIALMVEANAPQITLQIPSREAPETRASALAVGFALASGLLPKLAYGGSMDWTMALRPWLSGQIGGTFFVPESTVQAGRGGEFWGALAGASLCPPIVTSRMVEGSVCLGGRAGIIHGVGVGLPYTGSPSKPYGDAEIHARASFRLHDTLAAFVQVGLALPWLRPRFVYLDESEVPVTVHRPQPLLFFASAGLEQRTGGPGSQALP